MKPMNAFFAALVAAAVALPASAFAQCQERIDEVAGQVPDLTETAQPTGQLGVSEEALEAVLATLDAARIANEAGSEQLCMTLVDAAEQELTGQNGSGMPSPTQGQSQ